MPDYQISGRYQQLHYFRWHGSAPNALTAEKHVKALFMARSEDEDLSQQGVHLTFTSCAVQQLKVQEVATPPTHVVTPLPQVPRPATDPHPLYVLHTAWRALSPQERREFLSEMLTPNDRRFVALGLDEEAE